MPEPAGIPSQVVLVVDFGAQYAQLIARRVREAGVYSEIVPHDVTARELRSRKTCGVILSGGPASVHVPGAPSMDPEIYALGVPVLGICYGAQLIAQQLGGDVAATGRGEYGRTRAVEAVFLDRHHDAVEVQDRQPRVRVRLAQLFQGLGHGRTARTVR